MASPEHIVEVLSFNVEYGTAKVKGRLMPDRITYQLLGSWTPANTAIQSTADGYDAAVELAKEMAIELESAIKTHENAMKKMTTLQRRDFKKQS